MADLGGRTREQRVGLLTQFLMRGASVCAHKARAKFMLARLDFVPQDGERSASDRLGRLASAQDLVLDALDDAAASVYGIRPSRTPLLPF